jgi:hypothetical protein
MLLRCRRGTVESGCGLFVDGRPGSVEQMSQPRSSDFGSRGEGGNSPPTSASPRPPARLRASSTRNRGEVARALGADEGGY